jgi:hypothetical protein
MRIEDHLEAWWEVGSTRVGEAVQREMVPGAPVKEADESRYVSLSIGGQEQRGSLD